MRSTARPALGVRPCLSRPSEWAWNGACLLLRFACSCGCWCCSPSQVFLEPWRVFRTPYAPFCWFSIGYLSLWNCNNSFIFFFWIKVSIRHSRPFASLSGAERLAKNCVGAEHVSMLLYILYVRSLSRQHRGASTALHITSVVSPVS